MAGTYPNVPATRLAYDRDGTVVVTYDNIINSVTQVSSVNTAKINSEDDAVAFSISSSSSASEFFIGFMFPENRTLDGIFVSGYNPAGADDFMVANLEYSTDTTNMLDGTWTEALASVSFSASPKPYYRNSIQSLSIGSAKAIRIKDVSNSSNMGQVKNIHLYGSIIPTSSRLMFSNSSGNALAGSYFDFGDVSQGTMAYKEFYIKNLSSTLTATNIILSVEALTDTTPTNAGQYTFDDLITQGLTYTIASLGPESIVGPIRLVRSTSASAELGTWTVRVLAEVQGTWS